LDYISCFLILRSPLRSTLFPYTTLFRSEIPFLPIQFFKTQKVSTINQKPQVTFTSSGTTGMINSQHYVYDLDWYEMSFRKAFKRSEEHTSELQSRENLVCRLLLEKKKL